MATFMSLLLTTGYVFFRNLSGEYPDGIPGISDLARKSVDQVPEEEGEGQPR